MPSFQELIDELLGKNGPMHYKKLTEEILKVKQTKGKTPDQTILSILSKGKDRYEKVGDGVYRLKAGAEAEARAEAGVEAQAGAKEEEDGGTSARADAAAAVTDIAAAKAPDNEGTTTTTEQQQQPEGKQKDDGDDDDEDAGQDFEKVASALNKVFQGVGKLFRGYSQYKMAQAVFCGLLTGQPVLVIGDHASMKSSLSDFIGKKLFDKPVVRLSESFSSPDELRAWTEKKVASALSVDPDLLERNLLDGVIVEYSEYGGRVHCRVAIDAVKHPAASRLGEPKREPIWYYSKQITDQDSPEDILGYTITHPALLGMRPPHMVKEGRLTGADFIFLDELFSSPILVAHLHRALNEKVTDTELGQAEFRPLGLTAASVTGDTLVMIRQSGITRLQPISSVVDKLLPDGGFSPLAGEVLTFTGKDVAFAPFQGVFKHRVNEIYEVTYQGRGTIRTTGSHSLFVWDGGGIRSKEVSDLKPGDYLVTFVRKGGNHRAPLRAKQSTYVSQTIWTKKQQWDKKRPPRAIRLSKAFAEFLGYFVADGSTSGYDIEFSFNTKKDQPKVKRVHDLTVKLLRLKPRIVLRDGGAETGVRFGSRLLAEFLRASCGSDSHTKRIPDFLLDKPELLRSFFDGYMADGYADHKGRHYSTVSKALAEQCVWVLRLIGEPAICYQSTSKKRKIKGKTIAQSKHHIISISNQNGPKASPARSIPSSVLKALHDSEKSNWWKRDASGRFTASGLLTSYPWKNNKLVSPDRALQVIHDLKLKSGNHVQDVEAVEDAVKAGLGAAKVLSVNRSPFDVYVYDICGATNEAFFAGSPPVLSHNFNPFTSNYATNPKIMNFATFDRYAFSAETTAASTAEVLAMVSELKSREVKRLPVELIYAARELLDQVAVPEKLLHFAVVLVAHLSRCYFSTSQAERRMEAVSPFLLEGRDCQACIYSGYPCSIANITRTRAIINIERGMRALALLNGRKEATEEDLLNALLMVLPYRALWNNQEFVTAAGSPYNAAKELVSTFAAEVAKRKQGFEEIAQLYSTPDPGLAAELRKKYTDDVLLRSFIDEMVDQMKEAARKKSDQKTLQLLSKPIDLKDAMEVLK